MERASIPAQDVSPTDALPSADLSQTPGAPSFHDGQRLRRIAELQEQALVQPDPLQANLGAANGALMRIGYRLETALEDVLQQVSNPLDRFERLAPGIDTYLKVMRQVDRFAQLSERLSANRVKGG